MNEAQEPPFSLHNTLTKLNGISPYSITVVLLRKNKVALQRSILKTTFQIESYPLVTKQNQDLEILRSRMATNSGLFQMKALRPFPSC